MNLFAVVFSVFFLSLTSYAEDNQSNAPSSEQISDMININIQEAKRAVRSGEGLDAPLHGIDVTPYAEYKNQKYFIFNDKMSFSSLEIKEDFLKNLPDKIIPIIYTQNASPEYKTSLLETHGAFLNDPSKLEVLVLNSDGNSFWARDSIPIPVLLNGFNKTDLGLVDARYYHNFEPDKDVAYRFDAKLFNHDYFFEGGNFLSTSDGHCAVVQTTPTSIIPDDVFTKLYGCKKLTRFPHLKGIGHIDESLKFVSDTVALTDLEEYKDILVELGFEVYMLPKGAGSFGTYVNSVILGDVVYVPVFDTASDSEALAIYRNLGYEPVGMNSYHLSNTGKGSLHCISMVYPNIDLFN